MKTTSKHFVGFWHYGVILTYLSVASAIAGIFLSASYSPGWGVVCLLICGFCDAFDGTVAKTRKNRTVEDKMFGEQIDSLSDIIAFGVAPIMIGWGMGMRQWYFAPIFIVFSLCALVRLGYFNVTEELRIKEGDKGPRTSYEGLPVTNVAIGLPVFYMVATMFRDCSEAGLLANKFGFTNVTFAIMGAAYLLIAFLFVFRFKTPKFRVKGLAVTMVILLVIMFGLLAIQKFLLDYSPVWFFWIK